MHNYVSNNLNIYLLFLKSSSKNIPMHSKYAMGHKKGSKRAIHYDQLAFKQMYFINIAEIAFILQYQLCSLWLPFFFLFMQALLFREAVPIPWLV